MEFRILGPLEVLDDGRALDLGGAKQRATLAVLALHANRVVAHEQLIEALWDEEPPETARKALQVYVSQLRKVLGRERVETKPRGYLLRLDPDELDLTRFELLRDGGKPEQALELWRGEPLADFADQRFAEPEIARLEELRLACLEQRIERDLADGRHAELVGELDALVNEHPLREHLRAQLMLALYRAGRQAEALEAYQAARTALVEGLGIEPGPALRELHQRILTQDSALDLPAAMPTPARARPPAPPAHAPAPQPAGATRKTVTVLFCDLTGSTELGEPLDPESLRGLMTRWYAAMREPVERHSGTLEKFIGDALMAVFGVPQVHEDDALRAVRAAVEMHERLARLNEELAAEGRPLLQIRIGITSGEVITSDDATAVVTGAAVTTAKRLQEAAAPGEILIGDATRQLVENAAELEPVDPVQAKGKKKPVAAWRVIGTIEGAEPFARRLDTPLVDRSGRARPAPRRARRGGARAHLPPRHGVRRGRDRQVAPRGGARRAGRRPSRRRQRPLPALRRRDHVPAADGARPVGRRRAGGHGDARRGERRHADRRPGPAARSAPPPRRARARRRSGRSAGCSRRWPAAARSSCASRTCTGPSRRSSTCSSTSPAGAATRRSCCSASRGPTCSTSGRAGAARRSRSSR